jgi:hypothetical protein
MLEEKTMPRETQVSSVSGRRRVLSVHAGIFTAVTACVLFDTAISGAIADDIGSPKEIMAQSITRYAELRSYSDSGTVVTEYRSPGGPLVAAQRTFITLYSAPRRFLLDYTKDPQGARERYVLWGDGQDYRTWWSATKVQQLYPGSTAASAFAVSSYPTNGVATMIAPLVFGRSNIHGPLTDFTPGKAEGVEAVAGHRCVRISGQIGIPFGGSGAVTGAHAATIWIDVDTKLVRKIFEDSPAGTPPGFTDSSTTTFEPQADPPIDAQRFTFSPPAAGLPATAVSPSAARW